MAAGRAVAPPASVVETLAQPDIVRLRPGLYAAAFELMKLVPAKHIVESALERGELESGATVVETTSGTFGLALALVCAEHHLRLRLVSDPAIDSLLHVRLAGLSVEVEILTEPAAVGGIQQARLDRVAEVLETCDRAFWPQQYDNPANPASYGPIGARIVEAIGRVDVLVAPVGSGGSACGLTRSIRRENPALRVVGVDSDGSVLFGHADRSRALRGMGNSILPKNLAHEEFDEVHWVTAPEGFSATRVLHDTTGLFMGPTSGAAFLVADHISRTEPDANVVVVLPDSGSRYGTTVYDDRWLGEGGYRLDRLPTAPIEVTYPTESPPQWSMLRWGRRTRDQVMGATSG